MYIYIYDYMCIFSLDLPSKNGGCPVRYLNFTKGYVGFSIVALLYYSYIIRYIHSGILLGLSGGILPSGYLT